MEEKEVKVEEEKKASSKKTLVIILAAVLAVCALCAIWFFVLSPALQNNSGENGENGQGGQTEAQNEPKPESAFIETKLTDEYKYDVYEDYVEIVKCLIRTENVVVVPDTLDDKPVYSLKEGAFTGCSLIEEITLPKDLREIGESCFAGCTGLTFVKLPDTLYSLGDNAFQNCLSLKDVSIPDGVKRIGNYAFDETPFYTDNHEEFFVVGDGVLIGYHGGGGDVILPEDIKMISSFSYIPGEETSPAILITGLTLPEGLEVIGDYALTACMNLGEINFPSTLKEIGNYAFSGCAMLTVTRFNEGLEIVGDHVFAFCVNLKSVSYPESVTRIGADQFENGGDALESIFVVPDSFAMKHFQNTAYADLIVEDTE